MITIYESGMRFGPFSESDIYYIEKSQLYQGISNSKTVEFILARRENSLYFVEAKSSSPRPTAENAVPFDVFIDEITDKFIHSLNLYYAGILKRHEVNNDIPDEFQEMEHATTNIKFLLIIKGHNIEWLPPIQEALIRKMMSYSSIWKFQIAVINDKMAVSKGLIRDPA